jgi:hypothetical protein
MHAVPPSPVDVPSWVGAVDRDLVEIARRVQPLGMATPVNAADERARLVPLFARGGAEMPQWTYAAHADASLDADLARLGDTLLPHAASPLGNVYSARVRELQTEATLCRVVGQRSFSAVAAARFAAVDAASEQAAQALARAWADEDDDAPASDPSAYVLSDADDPRSLVWRMRAEIGRLRLPFRVRVHSALASLAATGERTIFIAAGRALSEEAIQRTVVHEIEGHAAPRARAATRGPAILRVGTARGADEQEGFALGVEDKNGFLRGRRRRELAARYLTVDAMRAGATFVDAVRVLMQDHQMTAEGAVLVAERAYRGSDGTFAGLGRERVYLEAFLRVRAHLEAHPEDERVIRAGQVAIAAAPALRSLALTAS